MVDAGVQWTMPPQGVIKINAHGFFSDQPFENGNISGIGFVFRDHTGHIVRMVGGSLGIEEEMINEFYVLLTTLCRAYWENHNNIILETDNAGAYWEWSFVDLEGVIPEHRYVVNQLEQRKADRNLRMEVRAIIQESNHLARKYGRVICKMKMICKRRFWCKRKEYKENGSGCVSKVMVSIVSGLMSQYSYVKNFKMCV
ncbi:hypothetical protein POM88_044824 [Heracleum sosnowskyi]|uniref:RNase H type-1 domain-containing protein n=1 Tax=Heracleum sosnowskyi TaxID=360622 RepID=A0AAD8H3I6_9APIA|nr:hypothetical protein POM88_044824 [Heracleum sosnowskyi]